MTYAGLLVILVVVLIGVLLESLFPVGPAIVTVRHR